MSRDAIDFILVALTAIPVGTTFGRGGKNLDTKLHQAIYERREDPLVKELFAINRNYQDSPTVHGAFASYDTLSLDSRGPDGRYFITGRAHSLGQKSLRSFTPEEQAYILNFGRELISEPVAA